MGLMVKGVTKKLLIFYHFVNKKIGSFSDDYRC